MRLWGLLLTFSLVLAEDIDNDICDMCYQETSNTGPVILEEGQGMYINSNLSKMECLIYNANLLSCNLRTDPSFPEDTQYSASFQYCYTQDEHPLNCSSESSKQLVECQGLIHLCDEMSVKINISINGSLLIICQKYVPEGIEKLDPPQNITTSIKSENLEIQWLPARGCCYGTENNCLIYELKINDELVQLEYKSAYNITNFDPTRSYSIEIRTQPGNACGHSKHWSDWSKAVVFGPSGNHYKLNPGVIVSIAFVLPMILLSFLLVCKFQRLFEKLFPSIPNPSKNVQMLLEKNDFNQVIPPKQCEEGTDILEVIG